MFVQIENSKFKKNTNKIALKFYRKLKLNNKLQLNRKNTTLTNNLYTNEMK